MSLNHQYRTYDIQTLIHALLNSKSAAPWNNWTVILGWPDLTTAGSSTTKASGDFDPTCYVLEPYKTNELHHFGGNIPLNEWGMIIGFWIQRKDGGVDEMVIWESQMLYIFEDKATVQTTSFNVTLRNTTHTGTTLNAQGLHVLGIINPTQNLSDEKDTFRKEVTLLLRG